MLVGFLAVFAFYWALIFGGPYDPRHILHAWRLELFSPRTWIKTATADILVRPFGLVTGSPSLDQSTVEIDNSRELGGGASVRIAAAQQRNTRAILHFEIDAISGPLPTIRASDRAGSLFKNSEQQNQFVVQLEKGIDLFVFSSEQVKFRLKNFRVEVCSEPLRPECKTDDDLIAQIKAAPDFPKSATQFELAKYLLNWAAISADYDVGAELSKIAEQKFSAASAGEIYYQYYEPSRVGGYCSSVATFLSKLLRIFDLDAFTVDFGAQSASHVTVVMRSADYGKYYILDPTFNGYFTDAAGGMLDIGEILRMPRTLPIFKQQNVSARDFLLTEAEYLGRVDKGDLRDCHLSQTSNPEKIWICKRDAFELRSFLQSLGGAPGGTKPILDDDYGFFEMMKSGVSGVGNGLRASTREEFIAFLGANKIEMADKGN